jgi:hypothetical protein
MSQAFGRGSSLPNTGRGGVVEDVLYENIDIEGARAVSGFNMDAFSTIWLPEEFRTPVSPEKGNPVFRNFQIRNLTARNCAAAGRLVGLAESPLRGLTLQNVDIQAHFGFTVKHALGLRFDNVKVNGEAVSTPSDSVSSDVRGKLPVPVGQALSARYGEVSPRHWPNRSTNGPHNDVVLAPALVHRKDPANRSPCEGTRPTGGELAVL